MSKFQTLHAKECIGFSYSMTLKLSYKKPNKLYLISSDNSKVALFRPMKNIRMSNRLISFIFIFSFCSASMLLKNPQKSLCTFHGKPAYYGFHFMIPFIDFFANRPNNDPLKIQYGSIIKAFHAKYREIQKIILRNNSRLFEILFVDLIELSRRLEKLCSKIGSPPFDHEFCSGLATYVSHWSCLLDLTMPNPKYFRYSASENREESILTMTESVVDAINFNLNEFNRITPVDIRFAAVVENVVRVFNIYEDLYRCIVNRLIINNIDKFNGILTNGLMRNFHLLFSTFRTRRNESPGYQQYMQDRLSRPAVIREKLFVHNNLLIEFSNCMNTAGIQAQDCMHLLYAKPFYNVNIIITISTYIHEFRAFQTKKSQMAVSSQRIFITALKRLIYEGPYILTWVKQYLLRDLYIDSPFAFPFGSFEFLENRIIAIGQGQILPSIFSLYIKHFENAALLNIIFFVRFLSAEVILWDRHLSEESFSNLEVHQNDRLTDILGDEFLALFRKFVIAYSVCLFNCNIFFYLVNYSYDDINQALLEMAKCLFELIDYEKINMMPECFRDLVKLHRDLYGFYWRKGFIKYNPSESREFNKNLEWYSELWSMFIPRETGSESSSWSDKR